MNNLTHNMKVASHKAHYHLHKKQPELSSFHNHCINSSYSIYRPQFYIRCAIDIWSYEVDLELVD